MSPLICPSCGKENPDNAKFCTGCGENLSSISEVRRPSGTSAFVMGDMSSEPEPEQQTTAQNRTRKDTCMGQVLEGKYLILEHLGDGGMGTVYKAEQLTLNKTVAIKILHKSLLQDDVQVKRFQREAWSASRLEHPHSIQIIDFGQTPEGNHYIVMEFLKGRELTDVIRKDYPLAPERIVHILCQVCSVLAEAHANKIIHRDLKPENIVLIERAEEKDFVKVLDFGIAKLQERDPSRPALTMQGIVCGTPEYMSPEQAMGKDLDARTDIYSIGCILYEMLTGKVPYDANTYQAILTMHIQGDLTPPSSVAPQNVASGSPLEKICLKAMAREREKRFASALEMKQALESVLTEEVPESRKSISAYVSKPEKKTDKTETEGRRVASQAGDIYSQNQVKARSGMGIGSVLGIAAVAVLIVGGILYAAFSVKPEGTATFVEEKAPEPVPEDGSAAADDESLNKPTGKSAAGPVFIKHPELPKMSQSEQKRQDDRVIESGKQSKKMLEHINSYSAEERKRKSVFFYEKGKKEFMSGNDREAILNYIKARDYDPASKNVYKKLGVAYMRFGNKERARENFQKYIEIAPNAGDAQIYRNIMEKL